MWLLTPLIQKYQNIPLNLTDDDLLIPCRTGNPPMTGTTTLHIHVTDQNDNVPRPTVDRVDLCLSDITANITAFDPDGSPFSGPFSYELLGDVAGKWRLDPSYGRKLCM